VRIGDLLDDGQSQSDAAAFWLLGKAGPAIGHRHPGPVTVHPGADPDLGAWLRDHDRVVEEIGEGAVQGHGYAFDHGRRRLHHQ
jgi:hypothetical protein